MAKKAEKKYKDVRCAKCNLEFPESVMSEDHKNKAFIWEGKVLCPDCLMMQGGNPGTATTWWDFEKDPSHAKPHDW